jgi:putative CocE/NonD family hydrolase
VATDAGDDLAALAIQVSASQFHGQTYPGGSLSLQTSGSWLVLVAMQERRLAPVAMLRGLRRLPTLFAQLPIADLDQRATGAEVEWFRQALANTRREDDYWVARDFAEGVGKVTAPVQLIGGWHDIFLPWMLADFAALHAAGRQPQLTIGPWTHTAPGLLAASMREGLAWLRARLLLDDRLVRRATVRVFITGEGDGAGWRNLSSWPPDAGQRRLWLGELETLNAQAPAARDVSVSGAAEPAAGDASVPGAAGPAGPAGDRYRYDPSDPTPSLGGAVLLAREPVADNRSLEARADVLTYTTPPLPGDLVCIGTARVELWVRTSSPYFDLFARVCEVDGEGVSRNVCDALTRVTPERFEQQADGSWQVSFELWPLGHSFAAGNRIRLQVSSGAHPRFARNPGTGDDSPLATELRAVDIELLHDHVHPSALILPAS